MTNFEEQYRTRGKVHEHVPKWKKLLSLKNSSSITKIEENEIKLKNKESQIDHSFKTIEKKRKSDNEFSNERGKKKKKNERKKKKQNEKTHEEKDNNRNENKQFLSEKKVMDDSNSVLIVEQTKLNIPEEFTNAVKAGLNYLITWCYHQEKWKFQKTRQTWLLKNAYNEDLLSEDFFKLFLEYIAKLLGQSRNTTLKIAQDIVDGLESEDQRDETPDQKDYNEKRKEQVKLNRAKEIVRVLS